MNCPQCGNQNEPGAAFCDNCGASLTGVASPPPAASPAAGGNTCPQCGQPVVPGEAFCDNCGAALSTTPPPATPPQPAPPPPQQPPPAAPAGGGTICPNCGTQAPPGAAFCDNCGASLSAAGGPPPAQQPYQQPYQQPAQQPYQQPYQQPVAVGPPPRLVVQSSNASLPFPAGKAEIIAGREDPVSNVFPEVDLDPHGGDEGGVSRRHAKFTLQGSQWYVQDLQSTNFTFVNKQKLQPNQPHPVNNGDEVRLGRVVMTFFTS